MNKVSHYIALFILFVLHIVFVATLYKDDLNLLKLSGIILIGVSLVLFYLHPRHQHKTAIRKSDYLLILYTTFGAIGTYFLFTEFKISNVIAAAVVGLISTPIPRIFKRKILNRLPAAVYCGAFAGMTAPEISNGYYFIILAGILTGLLLIFSKDLLNGYGGKLGSIAFGGVALVNLILYVAA